jgi:uncharacterized repeat protein (TIGR02543 family)
MAVTAILTLFGVAHAAQLSLTWTDTSTNEDGFTLERKTGSAGAYGQLASLPAGTTGYVDTTVTAGTTYCYRVRAYNSAGDSAYSNEACATPASATLYTVTVTKSGAGSGTVTSSPTPPAIDCGGTCSATIAGGTSLALSATPATGSTFTGWSGACTGTGVCTLVVDTNKTLTATFGLSTYALSLTKTGTGTGTVTSTPTGINCGATCSATYNYNTSVTLTAAPATGSSFTGWSGACTGTTSTCQVTMTAAQSVTATFTATTATGGTSTGYLLTAATTGSGSGLIVSTPSGVYCGAMCSASFPSGTTITLSAVPTAGSTFAGWGGACSGRATTCTVTMASAQSVRAKFTRSR